MNRINWQAVYEFTLFALVFISGVATGIVGHNAF